MTRPPVVGDIVRCLAFDTWVVTAVDNQTVKLTLHSSRYKKYQTLFRHFYKKSKITNDVAHAVFKQYYFDDVQEVLDAELKEITDKYNGVWA